MNEWKNISEKCCPECGDDLEVFTDAEDGGCYDGDVVRCVACKFRSGMSVDEDGWAWIQEV